MSRAAAVNDRGTRPRNAAPKASLTAASTVLQSNGRDTIICLRSKCCISMLTPPYIGNIAGQSGNPTFGVCYNGDDEGNIEYMTGVEVDDFSRMSTDIVRRLCIPAGRISYLRSAITFRPSAWHGPRSGINGCQRPALNSPTPHSSSATGSRSIRGPVLADSNSGCR